jgi:hypothetical protein
LENLDHQAPAPDPLVGRRADTALETIDKAPAIDLKYLPAQLYRGQVLFEQKQH